MILLTIITNSVHNLEFRQNLAFDTKCPQSETPACFDNTLSDTIGHKIIVRLRNDRIRNYLCNDDVDFNQLN